MQPPHRTPTALQALRAAVALVLETGRSYHLTLPAGKQRTIRLVELTADRAKKGERT